MSRVRIKVIFINILVLSSTFSSAFVPSEINNSPLGAGASEMVNKAAGATELTATLACVMPNITIPEEMMKQAMGSQFQEKTCKPLWKKDGTGVDSMCLPYPATCQKIPKIPSQVFAVFTEAFPCFALNTCFIGKFDEAKKASPFTVMKCWFDIALCFFNACYPGLHPAILADLIKSGKLIHGAPGMVEGVGRMGGDLAQNQGGDLANSFG